jgi:hypothetical protein
MIALPVVTVAFVNTFQLLFFLFRQTRMTEIVQHKTSDDDEK